MIEIKAGCLSVDLDKLDLEYLQALCERTGKNQDDVVKLALALLHEKLCTQKAPIVAPFVPVQNPIVFPYPVECAPQPYVVKYDPVKREIWPNEPDLTWMQSQYDRTTCCNANGCGGVGFPYTWTGVTKFQFNADQDNQDNNNSSE